MENLKKIRAKKHVSQQAVADYLGITRQAYSNYENGNREPDYETLLKLAEYFDVSVDFILRGAQMKEKNLMPGAPELMAAFFEGAGDLPDEELNALWEDAQDYIQYKINQKRKNAKNHD